MKTKDQRWEKRAMNVTGWALPFPLQDTDCAVEIAVDPASLSSREKHLVDNGDIIPSYVKWWLAVAEMLYLDNGTFVSLAFKDTRRWRWRSADFVQVEFTFYDLLHLLSDSQVQWGMGWGATGVSTHRYRACAIPAWPYGAVIIGGNDEVSHVLERCWPSFN